MTNQQVAPCGGSARPIIIVEHDHDPEVHEVDVRGFGDRHQQRNDHQQDGDLVDHDRQQEEERIDAQQERRSATGAMPTRVLRKSCGTFSLATA